MTGELTLEQWLESTAERRAELEAYARSPLPDSPEGRHQDLDAAIQSADDAGRLLADCESYLSQAEAQAVFVAREKHEDLTADERKKVVKAETRHLRRLWDGLSVTHQSIKNRIYGNMNANRSR